MRLSIPLVSLVVAGFLAGCSGGPSADQACTDAAAASCAKLDACHTAGVALRYGDLATCLARIKANCLVAMGAPDTGRTPQNQEACAMAYAGATCSDYLQNTIAACQPPAGGRALGKSCAFSAQCQSAYCALSKTASCGTCAAPPTAGASCQATLCGNGQVCTQATTTCQPFGAAGAPCSNSGECQAGLACAIPTAGMPGTCQAGAETAAATCDPKAGPTCDYLKGLFCSVVPMMSSGTCVSYQHATAGQACGFTAGMGTTGSSFTQCTGAACIVPSGKSAGTCTAYASEGQACDTAAGPTCLAPARCVLSGTGTSGTCELPDPAKCS